MKLEDAPVPQVMLGIVLVETTASLISAGTERMLAEFGKTGYLSKARSQPDKVKQVLEKIKTKGLFPTIKATDGPNWISLCLWGLPMWHNHES